MNHNRPSLEKFKSLKPASGVTYKYSAVAEAKRKLAEAQLELVQKELTMKEEEHKKKMLLMDVQTENLCLEQAILRKKLAE
jgi:hypothetical protein